MKVKDIMDLMEDWAPLEIQEEWDNSGLQVGDPQAELTGIAIGLDCSHELIDYCIGKNINLIINHHPLIFSPKKFIVKTDYISGLIIKAIRNGINIYAAHTNLDAAQGGVNDILSKKLGLDLDHVLDEIEDGIGIGRYGSISPTSLKDLAQRCSQSLDTDLIYYGDPQRQIEKVGLVGGSGGSMIDRALDLGLDALITGDIKHHDHIDSLGQGLCLIDAGHYGTEQPICHGIKEYLEGNNINNIYIYEAENTRHMIQRN